MLGKKEEDVLVALSTLHPVAGRFDAIRSPQGYTAIVDYAHTPDALINVLNAIHGVLEGKGKVITVVGAGGNRDKGKRPIMAKEAAKASDRVIITSTIRVLKSRKTSSMTCLRTGCGRYEKNAKHCRP